MSKQERPQEDLAEQWEREKQENWEALKQRLGLDDPVHPIPPRKYAFSPRRIAAVCAASFVGVGVCVGAGILISSFFKDVTPTDPNRYCTQADYIKNLDISITLKDYSIENDNQILYFNWYNSIEDLACCTYNLKSNNEIIAFKESFYNFEIECFVNLYVTDNHTQIETLETTYTNRCTQETIQNINLLETKVKYYYSSSIGYSVFEYKNYCYYLEIDGIANADELFNLITQLTDGIS